MTASRPPARQPRIPSQPGASRCAPAGISTRPRAQRTSALPVIAAHYGGIGVHPCDTERG